MKLYTEKKVKELLAVLKYNCYVAVRKVSNEDIASAAIQAPLPGGDNFDEYYGFDPEVLFKEDLEDRELQGRYDRFIKSRDSAKESYNKCVPDLNLLSSKRTELKELIVTLAVKSLPTEEIVQQLLELEEEYDTLCKTAADYHVVMEENNTLINKYKSMSADKLFMHWKYLTMMKATEVPYLEWRVEYENIII
jgi:hypothetical protein